MSTSKITILGLEEYLRDTGKSLFDNMKLPEGIDKEILCDNIIQRGSDFEVEYPNADYMRSSIGVWSRKWYWTFNKWLVAINTEYKPLENYDRYEDWTDNNTHKDDDTINSERDITANQKNDTTSNMTTDTKELTEVEQTKSAFDSAGYSPYEKTNTDSDIEETNKVESNSNTDNTNNDKYTETKGNTGEYQNIHSGHLHGNIGVTSAQDMLRQEIDIAYFNLYDRITDIFINEYCIPIYI